MSPAVSPSPSPSSGSLLVTDTSRKATDGSQRSATCTLVVTGTSLWFGGQSVPTLSDTVICGATVSATRTDEGHIWALPPASRAVKVTGVVPIGSVGGASTDSTGAASHTSEAAADAKNGASC